MNIRDVMTPNPRTISPDESIQNAARIMRDLDTGVVPVVENGRPVGMVTDRDIVVRVIAEVGIVSSGDLAVKEGTDKRVGDALQDISQGVKERG